MTSVLGLEGIGLVVIIIERSYLFTLGCSFYIAQIIIGTIKEIEIIWRSNNKIKDFEGNMLNGNCGSI